jgi:phage terminase Nu1 subunit (DNA packaging protein)
MEQIGGRLKSTQEIADILDLSIPTIKRYCRDGMPHDTGTTKQGNRFDEAECAAWIKANNKTGKPGRQSEPVTDDIRALKARKELALCIKYETDNAVAHGLLISKADEERRDVQNITAVRNRLSALGSTLAVQLEGLAAPERQTVIDAAIENVLKEFSKA